MDIGSGKGYPASALSNFSPYEFTIDGIKCSSMEGFLQSLKFSNIEMQKHVCTLVGKQAKFKGKNKNWQRNQTLYWMGKPIKRESKEYTKLLEKAYFELSKNEKFKKALLSTNNATLTHSLGHNKKSNTVLTEREFCKILHETRSRLQQEK